jgi:hypothetical protein
MPLHFNDRDVLSEAAGLRSALIVPCNLCPAVTVAVREHKPFLRFWRNPFRSAPFEKHLDALQCRLRDVGVTTRVFRSHLYHQWFLCIWSARRRRKLKNCAKKYDAVIVLGCPSATETVRESVESTGVKVIEGMTASGVMNARLKLKWPGTLCFEDSKVVPMSE